MQRRLIAVALFLCSLAAPSAALSAQTNVNITAGVAEPVKDLGDAADLGYHVAAGLNFGGTRLPIGARIEGALNGFNLNGLDESVRVWNVTANAVLNLTQRPDSPYLIGGLGWYESKFGQAAYEGAVGVNLGGGLRFPVGQLTTFFETRYHAMLGESGRGANLQFIPITFGVVF